MFGWQQSNGSFTEQKKLRVHLFEQQPRVRIGEYRVRFVPGQDISDLCKAIELEFEHELAARHFSATSFTVKTASGGALARDVKLSDIPLEQGDRKRRLYVEVGDPDRDRVLLNCSSCIPFIAEFEAFIALFVASAMFYVFICLDVHNGGWREHFSKGLAMVPRTRHDIHIINVSFRLVLDRLSRPWRPFPDCRVVSPGLVVVLLLLVSAVGWPEVFCSVLIGLAFAYFLVWWEEGVRGRRARNSYALHSSALRIVGGDRTEEYRIITV